MAKTKKHITAEQLFTFAVALVCGFFFGIFLGAGIAAVDDKEGFSLVMTIISVAAAFIVSFLFHVITHEAGHLIFGLATGYRFLSFRIFNHVFIRENGKTVLKKFSIPGTAGQCLLAPPVVGDPKELPFKLYFMGGYIINYFFSLVGAVLYAAFAQSINNNPDSFYLGSMLMVFTISGFYLAVINSIPLTKTIINDGGNIRLLTKKPSLLRYYKNQLEIYEKSLKSMKISEMPAELFYVSPDDDAKNPFIISINCSRAQWYEQNGDIDKAKSIYDSVLENENISEILKYYVRAERLWLELVTENNPETIEKLYDKKTQQLIMSQAPYDLSKTRILLAYTLLQGGDEKQAEKLWKTAEKNKKTFVEKGELRAEEEKLLLLKRLYDEKKAGENDKPN